MNEQATEHAKTTASFDPESFLLVPAKRFEDLKVGDVFRAPSRTLTDAHDLPFRQFLPTITPSTTTLCGPHGTGTLRRWLTGFSYLLLLLLARHSFRIYIGDVFIAFTELSCKFLKEVHAGETFYSALEIVDLSREGENGLVTTRVTVFNQRHEMVLSGQHKYLLKAVQ